MDGSLGGNPGRRRLLIVAQLPPPVHGAAVVNQMVVDSPVLRERFDVSVVPIDATVELSEIRKFSVAKLARTARMMAKITGELVFCRPRLAYLTLAPKGFAFYRDAAVVLLFRLFAVRHVLHLHGRGMKKGLKARWQARLARAVMRKATVIHLSPALFSDIAPFTSRASVRFVANGVVDPGRRDEARLARDIPQILFLSTMLESKGPLVLLDALAKLKQENTAFTAVFAGPWRGSITLGEFESRKRALGLDPCVRHVGPVYGDAKRSIFMQSDIFAFPTNYENEAFPLVVLEAMAAGLVPVTSNVAALPDIVEGAGICVAPNDPSGLAAALRQLLDDRALLGSLQAKARAKYASEFTQARFEERLTSVLEEAAGVDRKPEASRTAQTAA